MEISLIKILNILPLYQRIKTIILPVTTAYKFSKLFKQFEEYSNFYTEELTKLLNEYGKKDEDGNLVPLPERNGYEILPENIETMQNKLNELWNTTFLVADYKFNLNELEELKLSIEEFDLLIPWIEE